MILIDFQEPLSEGERFIEVIRPIVDDLTPAEREAHLQRALDISGIERVDFSREA